MHLSPDCGLVVQAMLVPHRTNPELVERLQVGVVDQAGGYRLISATEQELGQAEQQRRAQEVERAAKNTKSPAARVAAATPAGRFAARTREIVNPDQPAMVFLYFDLAGLKPPLEEWVEKDGRVQFAAPVDKPARRAAVRAELEAGLAAVREIGRIRLSIGNAQLSDYDPANGEFTVGALSPASELMFAALG